jgi:hypothetical protein
MRKTWLGFACAAALAASVIAQAADGVSAACDRSCLSKMLDDYMAALAAHDPSRLPLAKDVRFSENNVPLRVGDGLWNTIDKVDSYRLPFIEPDAGEAGMFGVVEENGHSAHFALRLKVVDGKIIEIETMVLRPRANNGFGRPQAMHRRTPFYQDVPKDERLTRVQLVEIANSYFETLQQNHGVVFAPFASDCDRIENGIHTTNNPAPSQTGRADQAGIKQLGCEAQFKTGFFQFVTHIRDRRYPIVDRQKGLVYAAAFFDHRGDMPKVKLTDGRVVPTNYDIPWSWQIGELFKISDNKIQRVEALVMYTPYGNPDLWTDRPRWAPAH